MRVPVIPVYFHGHNGTFFNILGLIDWRLRTLRLPRELFNKTGKTVRVSIGEPIMPEEQDRHPDLKEFGAFLRQSTDSLRHQEK
jgi:putative hemolysin